MQKAIAYCIVVIAASVPLELRAQRGRTSKPAAAAPAPLTAPITRTEENAIPLPGPDLKTVTAFITKSCNAQWSAATEKGNRDLCREQEAESAAALLDRDMSSPTVRLIRRDCHEKNLGSYTMWNGCERTKLKAAAAALPTSMDREREPSAAEAVAIIRTKCAKDWPDDFSMRAYCQKQHDDGIAAMAARSMVSGDRARTRTKCFSDWPDDYRMRNYCEERQLEALAKIR